VVQANNLDTQLPQTVIAMITSNMAGAGHPSRVTLSVSSLAGKRAGILMDSVVMTDNLTTVRDSEIDRTLGTVLELAEIDHALQHTLGFR
jgi:mRNA interferase MazF